MKTIFAFVIIFLTSTLSVKSQEQNANLNSTYRSINTYSFDEDQKDWVLAEDSTSVITFSIIDSTIQVNQNQYHITSIKKKKNKKTKSMEYYFVLQNEDLHFIDAEFYQHWYNNERFVPQFIIKDKAYDLK